MSSSDNGFKYLDSKLLSDYEKDSDFKDFLREPKDFRSLQHVMTLLRDVNVFGSTTIGHNPIYLDLLERKKAAENNIEKVVKFQHGGLNHTVDTMSEVVKSYIKGRDEINTVCVSLAHTKEVLDNKKISQQKLRELWLKKLEIEESLRLIKDIEYVKDSPMIVQNLITQKRFLAAVTTLKFAYDNMFHDDLASVGSLSQVHKVILDLKENVIEKILNEVQVVIHDKGANIDIYDDNLTDYEDDDGNYSESRSESAASTVITPYDTFNIMDNGSTNKLNLNSFTLDSKDAYDRLLESCTVDRKHVETLLNLSQETEDKISDPSKMGLFYVRLLVKSLTKLYNEDDYIETLLFNNLSSKFQSIVIYNERRRAKARLQRTLDEKENLLSQSYAESNGNKNELGNESSSSAFASNEEYSIHSVVFSSYINNLINRSANCLKSICYVLRLLDFDRQLRYSTANLSNDSDEDKEEETEEEQRKVNDTRNVNSSDTKKISSVLQYNMSNSNKERLKIWWRSIETMICNELKHHLIETDVENISDNRNNKSQLLHFDRQGKNGREEGEYHDNDDRYEMDATLLTPIVPPTAKLSTPIYKKIVSNHYMISNLMLSEGLYSSIANSNIVGTLSNTSPNKIFSEVNVQTNTKLTILQQIAKATHDNNLNTYSDYLLNFINTFIENELLPITQSYINSEMREIQTNSKLFNFRLQDQNVVDDIASRPSEGNVFTNVNILAEVTKESREKNSVILLNQNIILNSATIKCSSTTQLLFKFWVDLNSHRDMVITILDRLIRGFSSCANVELENISWKLYSCEPKYITQSLNVLATDELFLMYRQKFYKGNASIDHIIERKLKYLDKKYDDLDGVKNKNLSSDSNTKTALPDVSIWAILLGNIGNSSSYPVNKSNTVRDITSLETVSSILQGCEWMSFELIKYCTLATSKDTRDWQHFPEKANSHFLNGHDQTSELLKTSSRNNRDMHISLWQVTESVAKELSKISDKCLSVVRNEVQVICFLHLNQLANIASLKAVFVTTINPVIDKNEKLHATHVSSSLNHDTTEAEVIIDELIHHIDDIMHRILNKVLPREIVSVIISPLCTLIPRIVMRCFQHLISPHISTTSNFGDHNYMSELPLDQKVVHFSLDCGKYLRIVVTLQQLLTTSIESYQLEPSIARQFIDKLIDESERLRKYLKLLEMTSKELKGYIRENPNEYSNLEYLSLWDVMCARSSEKQMVFEDFVSKVTTSRLQAPS